MTVYGGGTPPRQHFGVPEMRAYAEAHDDERVKLMMRRIEELLSKSAKWCDAVNRLEQELHDAQEEVLRWELKYVDAAAELARLRDTTRWRSVEEELPPDDMDEVLFYDGRNIDIADKLDGVWYHEFGRVDMPSNELWMPLPELPKEKP